MAKVKVAVIGLGSIGSGYYSADNANAQPRTHVETILRNQSLELTAVCDADQEQRKHFKSRWKEVAPIYTSATELLAAGPFDIVSVATPSGTHYEVLCEVLAARPHAIFCEKPMCADAETAADIVLRSRAVGIPVVVNYHRRWDLRIRGFRAVLGEAGPPQRIELIYTKGLYNYGAHAIDLLQLLFGAIQRIDARANASIPPGNPDPSLSASLFFDNGLTASFAGVDGLDYELVDLDMFCRHQKYRLEFGGQRILCAKPEADRYFDGYVSLRDPEPLIADAPVHGLSLAYEELAAWVTARQLPQTSSAENALAVHRVLATIKTSVETGEVIKP